MTGVPSHQKTSLSPVPEECSYSCYVYSQPRVVMSDEVSLEHGGQYSREMRLRIIASYVLL